MDVDFVDKQEYLRLVKINKTNPLKLVHGSISGEPFHKFINTSSILLQAESTFGMLTIHGDRGPSAL